MAENIGGPCKLCGGLNIQHGGGQCPQPRTFDELFREHNLTAAERESLVQFLASLRATKTVRALSKPQEPNHGN